LDEWTWKKKKQKPERDRGKPVYIPHKADWLMALLVFGGVGLVVGATLLLLGPLLWGLTAVFLALPALLVGGVLLWGHFLFKGRKSRLVLDEEGLSLERGEGDVIGHIPYSNIASAEITKRFRGGGDDFYHYRDDFYHGRSGPGAEWLVLEIVLIKYNCPDTFWPKMESEGRSDIELPDEYTRPLSFIRERLLDGVRDYREQRGYRSLD
jgi:hypothetical protein